MSPRRRGGYTLAELLVAAVIGGLVSTAAVATAARVRGASGREAERAVARAQLAQAVGVVGAELAGAAASNVAEGGDLAELSDTAVDVRAVVGGAVVCAPPVGGVPGSTVSLAAGDVAVGWWAAAPQAGDVALVHDPGVAAGAEDDAWTARAVRGVSGAASACAGGPFAGAAVAGGAVPWRLTLDGPPLPATVGVGAPVRVLRRRRYTLYRGGDGLWALGLREWDAGAWTGVQPLAGPFDAPVAGGMRVVVRDSVGAERAPALPLPAGAELEVRFAASRRWGRQAWRDSARAIVRLRGDGGLP